MERLPNHCQPMVEAILEEHPDAEVVEIELRPEVCVKLKCKYLLKSKHGAYRCSSFMQELRGRKPKAMKHTDVLRMHKDRTSGWTYRKL